MLSRVARGAAQVDAVSVYEAVAMRVPAGPRARGTRHGCAWMPLARWCSCCQATKPCTGRSRWRNGSALCAVLLSGYGESTVAGAGAALGHVHRRVLRVQARLGRNSSISRAKSCAAPGGTSITFQSAYAEFYVARVSELRAQQQRQPFVDAPAELPVPPLLQHHAARLQDVGVDEPDLLAREIVAEHIEIGFVVQPERPIVEVGGSDRASTRRRSRAPSSASSSADTRRSGCRTAAARRTGPAQPSGRCARRYAGPAPRCARELRGSPPNTALPR